MSSINELRPELRPLSFAQWTVDGHDFEESKAVIDARFCGLALDEDSQSDLTEDRINAWPRQLKGELKLTDSFESV